MIIIFGEAKNADIFYRCGWNSDVDVIYTEDGDKKTLYVPGFEYLRAKKEVSDEITVEKLTDPYELLASFSGPVVIPTRFPYALGEKLSGKVETKRVMFPERSVKEWSEREKIAAAQEAAREAIAAVEKKLLSVELVNGVAAYGGAPLTAEDLKLEARSVLIKKGFDCPDIIVSSGGQTGLPHHRGTGPIGEGPVIVDVFPRSESTLFHGDMTRTFFLGKHEKAEKMLLAVKRAHKECIALCTPGRKASEIHEHAQKVLEEEGFATNEEHGFIHALGHGVGLSIHESPSLSPKDDTVLEENMVVTVEPGLYYDVGVRWEDIVVVGSQPRVL